MARSDGLRIRRMVPPDIRSVAELENSVYPRPWSLRVFRDELAMTNRRYYVAEDEDGLVGYGGMMLVGEDGHITTLAVREEARQRGVGTRLLLCLIEAALEGGARNLTLEVRMSNQAAQELYRRFGFAPVGMRRDYYRDEDALVMWAIDVDEPEYRSRMDRIRKAAS